jgi:hypothetical protein
MTTKELTHRGAESALAAPDPAAIIRQATREANALSQVIEDRTLYTMIQQRKYVRVEGWTTLAVMRGCLAREVDTTEQQDGRYVAVVELVRLTDGAVLTRASAECGGPGEPTWQNRPPYARRSMAQTRAAGKACRIAFSWVMALTGYETTPAEEMDGVAPAARSQAKARAPRRNGGGGEATTKQIEFMRRLQDNELLPDGYRDRLAELLSVDHLSKDDASKAIGICTEELDRRKKEQAPDEEPPPVDADEEPPWMRADPGDIPV